MPSYGHLSRIPHEPSRTLFKAVLDNIGALEKQVADLNAAAETPVATTGVTLATVQQFVASYVAATPSSSSGVSGVSSLTAGAGMSVSAATGDVTVTNTGVTSAVAGTGIGVSAATGAVTFTNTGVTSLVAGTAITISGATGAVTVSVSTVPLANGGTNAALVASNGGMVYSTATAFAVLAGTATAGLALVSGASTTPSWFTPTANNVIYAGTGGILSGLAVNSTATNKYLQQVSSGAPSWQPVVESITGTANQVIASASTSAVTLSLPQSIATSSTPQFSALGLGGAAGGASTLKITGTTSGSVSIAVAATVGGDYTITLPKGSTDFSATGGTNQIVKQASAGAAFTVGTIASTGLSDVTAWTDWTPVITFGGGSTGQTFTLQQGRYAQVNKIVYVFARILFSNKGSSTGTALLTGLPITVAGFQNSISVWANNLAVGVLCPMALFTNSGTTINLYRFATGAVTALAETDFNNNSDLIITGFYEAA
jgi:hypothetical protein